MENGLSSRRYHTRHGRYQFTDWCNLDTCPTFNFNEYLKGKSGFTSLVDELYDRWRIMVGEDTLEVFQIRVIAVFVCPTRAINKSVINYAVFNIETSSFKTRGPLCVQGGQKSSVRIKFE